MSYWDKLTALPLVETHTEIPVCDKIRIKKISVGTPPKFIKYHTDTKLGLYVHFNNVILGQAHRNPHRDASL